MSTDPVEDADCFGDKLEQEEEEYYEQLDFQRNNWLDAVTKAPESSIEIFLDTLCNNNFEQRVAKLLIDGYNLGTIDITKVYKLFDEMSTEFAKTKI